MKDTGLKGTVLEVPIQDITKESQVLFRMKIHECKTEDGFTYIRENKSFSWCDIDHNQLSTLIVRSETVFDDNTKFYPLAYAYWSFALKNYEEYESQPIMITHCEHGKEIAVLSLWFKDLILKDILI